MSRFFVAGLCMVLWCSPAAASPEKATVRKDTTPEESIALIAKAIDANDTGMFLQYVDLDHLVSQSLDVFLESTKPREGKPAASVVKLDGTFGALLEGARDPDMGAPVRGLVRGELRRAVLYGIASGKFSGTVDDTVSPSGVLATQMHTIKAGRRTIALSGDVRAEGDERLAPVTFHDVRANKKAQLILRLTREDTTWRVREIDNLDAFLEKLPSL